MTATLPASDPAHFRNTLGRFATGVTIVTTRDAQDTPVGLTVSSFNSVSLNPPLVLWSLSLASSSLPWFEQCEHYVINVLSANQLALAARFARGTPSERFEGVALARAPGGAPMLAETGAAWFECRNRSRYREGDHLILVGEVEHCGYSDAMPLVYHAGGFELTPTVEAPQ